MPISHKHEAEHHLYGIRPLCGAVRRKQQDLLQGKQEGPVLRGKYAVCQVQAILWVGVARGVQITLD